jgi:DNA-binding winged helix-turn-helix (wHTH) protein
MDVTSRLRFSPYVLDTVNEQLWRDRELIPLRAKPFVLLRYLLENPGRLISHKELRKAIWPSSHVSPGVLREYLREVRAALGDSADAPKFIETVARRGYRFLVQVQAGAVGPAAVRAPAPGINPATSAHIVGRGAELSRLRGVLAEALAGDRQIVLISGEAGIGKSDVARSVSRGGLR